MKQRYKISVTYSIVTPDSARHGDYSETGYETEEYKGTLKDVLSEVQNTLGYFENLNENSTHDQSLYGCDPEIDYATGEETYRAVHISTADRRFAYSKRSMLKLARVLKGVSK